MVSQGNNELTQAVAVRELSRFFAVARARGADLTVMPACPVDTFWHEFQKQAVEFSIFCHRHAHGEVAHRECQGHGLIEWVTEYQSMFGERLPAIWFYSPDGQTFNRRAWKTSNTGEVRLSWDCTPEIFAGNPPFDEASLNGHGRNTTATLELSNN